MKLFKHPCGSAVVADLYEELPAADRNAIVAEFYSRETALLGAKTSTATLKSLVDAWPTMDSTEKRSTMQRLILALNPIIEKAYVDPPAIHRCECPLYFKLERITIASCMFPVFMQCSQRNRALYNITLLNSTQRRWSRTYVLG